MRRATLSFIIPVLFVVGCGVEGTSWLINNQMERELGLDVHNQVIAEYPPINDPVVQAWIDEIGARIQIASSSVRGDLTYQFYVVNTNEVNAFAVPGGFIYVTKGLIDLVSNEAEIAAVVAHEVGHVAHRHGVARLERALAMGLITDLVLGGGFAAEAVNFLTSMILNTSYSQDQENDADDLGLLFTHGAGYNPWALVDLFHLFESLSSGSGWLPGWLSSHPHPLARAQRQTVRIEQFWPGLGREDASLVWESTGRFEEVRSVLRTYP